MSKSEQRLKVEPQTRRMPAILSVINALSGEVKCDCKPLLRER